MADIHVFKPILISRVANNDTDIQFADTDISVLVSAKYIGLLTYRCYPSDPHIGTSILASQRKNYRKNEFLLQIGKE